MTILLALESSCEACSVALWRDGDINQQLEMAPREHTRKMLPMVDALVAETGIALNDVDAFVFGAGPGSFTGLRIAVGIVQGLAFALDKPVIAIPSLLGMAHTALRTLDFVQRGSLVIAIDARMGEVYWAEYRMENDVVEEVSAVQVSRYDDVTPSATDFIALGSGWALPEMQTLADKATYLDSEFLPQAYDLLPIADRMLAEGQYQSAADAVPEYVRNTVSWKKIHEQ